MREPVTLVRTVDVAMTEQKSRWTLTAILIALSIVILPIPRSSTPGIAGSVLRGARLSGAPPAADALEHLRIRARLSRNAENVHRLALANLNAGATSVAGQLLEESTRLDPSNTAFALDLAVARLNEGRVADAAESIATIVQREPENLIARFDWAVALEHLANRPAAITAWKEYLERDSTSEWGLEARQHLAQLSIRRPAWEETRELLRPGVDRDTVRRVVAEFPQRVRKRSQNVLLPAWASDGRTDELAVVRAIAEERAAKDPYLLDIVTNAEKMRSEVAPGLQAFGAGFQADNHRLTADGIRLYSDAAAILARAGSPLAIGAEIYAASMAVRGGDVAGCLRRIDSASARFAGLLPRYPGVSAEAEWVRSVAYMQLGEMQLSLDALRRARELAVRSGETENVNFIAAMIATDMEFLIEPSDAITFRIDALRDLDANRAEPEKLTIAYFETGYTALRNHSPHIAMAFLDSAVQTAGSARFPEELAASMTQRAYALLETDQLPRAEITLDASRHGAMQLSDPAVRDRILSEVEYVEGRIQQRIHPELADEAFRKAISINEHYGWHLQAASAYIGRGDSAMALGDRAAAELAYRAGVAEMEHERSGITEPAMRIAYFERAGGPFERLIQLLVDEGRLGEALTIAERKRARAMLDEISGSSSAEPIDAAGMIHGVASGALLEVALLDRGAEVWLVTDGHITHGRSTASGADIEAAVKNHLAAINDGDETEVKREGRWLFEQIVAPVIGDLPSDGDLAIASEGSLQNLPFATLIGRDGKYLLEHYVIAAAPSASVFLHPRNGETFSDEVLAVAQPRPAGWEPLPNTATEVKGIAGLYRHGRVAVGEETSPDTFLDDAEEASLVHFAGHARSDLRHPSQSALLFESGSKPAQALTAEAIRRRQLRRRPLVVLAACGTGSGQIHRNEGIDSLAAAFLQAGARGVVATLWDLDDSTSAVFFRNFHKNLRAGARAADALREAQLKLLHSTEQRFRRPDAWGSTVVIGTF